MLTNQPKHLYLTSGDSILQAMTILNLKENTNTFNYLNKNKLKKKLIPGMPKYYFLRKNDK